MSDEDSTRQYPEDGSPDPFGTEATQGMSQDPNLDRTEVIPEDATVPSTGVPAGDSGAGGPSDHPGDEDKTKRGLIIALVVLGVLLVVVGLILAFTLGRSSSPAPTLSPPATFDAPPSPTQSPSPSPTPSPSPSPTPSPSPSPTTPSPSPTTPSPSPSPTR